MHTNFYFQSDSLNLRSVFPAILFYSRTLSFTYEDNGNGEDGGDQNGDGDDDVLRTSLLSWTESLPLEKMVIQQII